MMEESLGDMEGTVQITELSSMNLNESWVELGTGESTMATTVRITENFASNTEKQYLADLEKELNKPEQITDPQKEKKIADTLAKLVLIGDVAETANRCMGIFVRSKLRTVDFLSGITDLLYDHFATSLDAAERKTSVVALKNLITEIQLDPCIAMTRELKIAYRLVELLIPRISGGLNKANMEDSMELMGLILRRFGMITRTHRDFKNIHLWQEYFCTGVVLGKGAYATVFLGRHVKTAKAVAIKTMDWDNLTRGKPKQEAALTNEIDIMRASDHPNIVRLYDVIKDGCMIHLVMEYCGGGTLEEYIQNKGPISEEDCRAFVRQLALGLKFLRDKGIIHRDLKPENLLLSTEKEAATLKIADFTFARFIEPGDLATTLVGSPLYMAPEMFLDYKYTEKADLWSVGAIVYKILTKEPPYPSKSVPELIRNFTSRAPRMPDNISADMKDLLSSLLERNPDLRISWTEFFLHKCLNLNTLGQSSMVNQLTESEQMIVKDHELSELRKELEGMKATNERMQQEIGGMERQLREAAQREQKLVEERTMLMGELAKLKDGSDTKKKDGDNWLKLIAREQQISAELEMESRHWQAVSEAQEAERIKLQTELGNFKALEMEWKTREAESNAEKQMVYAEIKELRSAINEVREQHQKEVQEAAAKLEASRQQITALQRQLHDREAESVRKSQEEELLLRERRQLSVMKEEMDAINAVAQMQLQEGRQEKEALLRAYEEETAKRDTELEQLRQQVSELLVYKLVVDEEMKDGKGSFFKRG